MKNIQLILLLFLATNLSISHAALLNYSVQGLVTSSGIVDMNGDSIVGKVATITFEYDDALTTSIVNFTEVTSPITVSVSVAGVSQNITSTSTIFENSNNTYDTHQCIDNFVGYGEDIPTSSGSTTSSLVFSFSASSISPDYCGPRTQKPTLLKPGLTAPDGAFVYDTGYVSIYGFGSMSVQYVPVPAAAWLLGSGLLGLAGVARRRRKV